MNGLLEPQEGVGLHLPGAAFSSTPAFRPALCSVEVEEPCPNLLGDSVLSTLEALLWS